MADSVAPRWPELAPTIAVDGSVGPLGPLWDRFEIFEALHHRQSICNPMNEPESARLLQLFLEHGRAASDTGSAGHGSWLDVACGSGEFLVSAHERGVERSVGLDLSPWMLNAAARRSRQRLNARPRPQWRLVDAAKWVPYRRFDAAACVGADWVWRGMRGTVGALGRLVAPGGVVAYGGPRLHFGADASAVTQQFGYLETVADVEDQLKVAELSIVERIDPGEQGWLDYLERGRLDAAEWARHYPGERSAQFVAEQDEWAAAFERDRELVGWSVWVATAM